MTRYSFNKLRFIIWAFVGGWFLWAANDDRKQVVGGLSNPEVGFEYLVALVVLLVLVWLVTVRVDVTKHGLTYRSLWGTRQIRWRDVRRLQVSWKQRYALRILPLYRAYRIAVLDRQDTSIVFGNRIQAASQAAEHILERSHEALLPLFEKDFEAGRPLDFGALVLTKKDGLRLSDEVSVQWPNVVNCELTEQELGILVKGGNHVVLSRRAVSFPTLCEHFILAGMGARTTAGVGRP